MRRPASSCLAWLLLTSAVVWGSPVFGRPVAITWFTAGDHGRSKAARHLRKKKKRDSGVTHPYGTGPLVSLFAVAVFAAFATSAAVAAIPAGNLIPNPSFESSMSGWNGWQSTRSRVALSNAPDGNYVAKAAQRMGTAFTINDSPASVQSATAGATYTATAYLASASSASNGEPGYVDLREYHSGSDVQDKYSGAVALASGRFQQATTSLQPKYAGDVIYTILEQVSAGLGSAFYADAISLVSSSSPPPPTPPPTSAPTNTTPQRISGTPQQGQTLTLTQGAWSGSPTQVNDRWQDCDSSRANCADISGATGGTYALQASDVGSTIRVSETATNSGGTGGPTQSAATAVVTATPSLPPPTGGCNGCTWNGDFSTGNFGQYASLLEGVASDFSLVTSNPTPPAPFKYAFDAHLGTESVKSGEAGERALLQIFPYTVRRQSLAPTRAYNGATTWYRDEIYFPSSYQPEANSDWNWMDEIHNAPDGEGPQLISCGVDTDTGTTPGPTSDGGGAISPARYSCRIAGGGNAADPMDSYGPSNWSTNPAAQYGYIYAIRSITPNKWYDVVWKISWSCTTGGSVTMWVNGAQVGSYSGPTLSYVVSAEDGYPTNGCNQGYWDDGDYRSSGDTTPSDVFHAGTMIGPTAASIGENLP